MTPDGEGFQFSFESIDRTLPIPGDRRLDALGGLHRHGALRPAGDADRPEVRVSGLRQPPAARGTRRRRHLCAGGHQGPRARSHRQADRVGPDGVRGRRKAGGSGALRPTGDRVLEGDLVLARDDSLSHRAHRSRWSPRVGRHGVLPASDGRPAARRAHPPSRGRPADHAARGGGDRGASRRRLRHFALRAGVRRGRPGAEGRSLRLEPTAPTAAGPGRTRWRPRISAFSRATSSPTMRARATSAAASGRRETRSDMFFLEVRPFSEEFVAGAEPGHVRHGERADRDARGRAEGDHQRDLEHRAPRGVGRGPLGRRHHRDCRGAGRAEEPRGADGVARRTGTRGDALSAAADAPASAAASGRRPIRWARRSRR